MIVEEALFEEIYKANRRAVFSVGLSILKDRLDAEDNTQNTFFKAARSFEQFRGECSLRTWLLHIAHTEALTVLRKKKTTIACAAELDFQPDCPDGRPDEETRMIAEEGTIRFERACAAINRLPADHQAVFRLFYWEGLSYEEAALRIGLPVSTIKTRLFRDRQAIRAECRAANYARGATMGNLR